MKPSRAGIGLFVLALLVTTSGCAVINRIRAKNEINEAARAYKAGKFAEAEQHSKRALELNPDDKNAPFFIARTIHAQYKPGVDTPENQQKAREAIEAYKKLLDKDPNNEEAYKAIAALYGALKEEETQRQWIMQRATKDSVDPKLRAEAYTVLASQDWNCSYGITELPDSKQTVNKDGKPTIQYKKPKEQSDFEKAQQCVARGLEEAEKAISLDPDNETAWSFKTNLLLESAKLAEMDGKMEDKAKFNQQAKEAQDKTTQLSEQNQKKKAEEEAKKAPKQPAS
jgi:tetratricopeptide (TPR) repeat protein